MSTPRDPQKANSWTRDLPKPVQRDARLVASGIVHMTDKYVALEQRARAVIAAGRPHLMVGRFDVPQVPCQCPQCAAYDALKTLLEP